MYNRLGTALKLTVIASLVLAVALSAVWARTYRRSFCQTVETGGGFTHTIFGNDTDTIELKLHPGALDAYLAEQGLQMVDIWGDLEAEDTRKGGQKRLTRVLLIFGPSGAHFDPPLELIVTGQVAQASLQVELYDDTGEVIESVRSDDGNQVIFYIPHFSSYSYDDYY